MHQKCYMFKVDEKSFLAQFKSLITALVPVNVLTPFKIIKDNYFIVTSMKNVTHFKQVDKQSIEIVTYDHK